MKSFTEKALELRAKIERAATFVDDTDAVEMIELFPSWDIKDYLVGDRVRFNGDLYKCLVAHTAQESWNPEDTPSLWAKVLAGQEGTEIGEWVQPDSTNPYMTGDKVLHNDKTWESAIDNNVWEPGVYGWNEI